MPKVVDPEERRAEVLEATWRVIARDGLENASMRVLAREVGWSTGVLSHYFRDKDEIIRTALQRAHNKILERAVARSSEFEGAAAVLAVLSEGMPLDPDRRLAMSVEVAYWGRIMVKPELEDYQRGVYERWWRVIRDLVATAEEKGQIRAGTNCDQLTTALIATADGISSTAAIFPDRLPPRAQLDTVRVVLEPALSAKAAGAVSALQESLLATLATDNGGPPFTKPHAGGTRAAHPRARSERVADLGTMGSRSA
jgi:AcrR family transcriptional regulator